MTETLSGILFRRRFIFAVLALCVVVLAASGIPRLSVENDYRIFFSDSNPQLTTFNHIQDTYTKSDNILVLVLDEGGDVFRPEVLRALELLTTASWQVPYTRRVDSIINFQHSVAEGDDILVHDLFSDIEQLTPDQIEQRAGVALNEPELLNRLVSPDREAAAVNITLELPLLEPLKEPGEAMQAAVEAVDVLRGQYPDLDFHISGVIPLNAAFSQHAVGDIKTLSPIMLSLIGLLLVLLFRSFVLSLMVLVISVLSILVGLGVSAWGGLNINSVSLTAPTIILTVAVADAVHIIVSALQFDANDQRGWHSAIKESLRVNLSPVLITSVTTALGFLALNFSDSPPFRELGTIVATGVIAAFVLTLALLPAALSLLPFKNSHGDVRGKKRLRAIAEFSIAWWKPILISMTAVAIGCVILIHRIELSDVMIHYFDESTVIRQDSDQITDHLTGVYSHNYSFDAGRAGGVTDPEFLRQLDAFANWLEAQPEVRFVSVVTHTLKRLNRNLHQEQQAYYRLPETAEQAAQYLFLYELSLPFGLDLTNHVNLDKSSAKIGVNINTLSSRQIIALERRAQQWLREHAPLLQSIGAGPATMFALISKRNVASMIEGTLIALVLVSFILIAALRSWKLGLTSLVPNILPSVIAFGIWSVIHGVVGLATSVVIAVTLGIVVDDTVHFLSKYQRARNELKQSVADAIRYAFDTVGLAIVVNTTILVAGFLVLTFSHFAINAEMGLLAAITFLIAMVLDFLLLPALLIFVESDRDHTPAV